VAKGYDLDKLSQQRRSDNMRQIRSKDTSPELALRRLVFRMGYRFRLHRKDLPGKPDLVFSGRKKVVFLHGCFWHQHPGCREGRVPSTRREYWEPKLARNQERDAFAQAALKSLGWGVLTLWECELAKNPAAISGELRRFLGPCTTSGFAHRPEKAMNGQSSLSRRKRLLPKSADSIIVL
jgi:DNA mismatch endonuclease (patch repair protein)